MILKNDEMLKINRVRLLGKGTTSNNYLTEDKKVLKEYMPSPNYSYLVKQHGFELSKHLESLSKEKSDALIVPKDIFVTDNDSVVGYTTEYNYGNIINNLYPKTNLDKLASAIAVLYKKIEELDHLYFVDMHEGNILYTGDLKLFDLDMCLYGEYPNIIEHNKAMINRSLYIALLKETGYKSPVLEEYRMLLNTGKMDFVDFFEIYRKCILESNGIETKYIRDLSVKKGRGR